MAKRWAGIPPAGRRSKTLCAAADMEAAVVQDTGDGEVGKEASGSTSSPKASRGLSRQWIRQKGLEYNSVARFCDRSPFGGLLKWPTRADCNPLALTPSMVRIHHPPISRAPTQGGAGPFPRWGRASHKVGPGGPPGRSTLGPALALVSVLENSVGRPLPLSGPHSPLGLSRPLGLSTLLSGQTLGAVDFIGEPRLFKTGPGAAHGTGPASGRAGRPVPPTQPDPAWAWFGKIHAGRPTVRR